MAHRRSIFLICILIFFVFSCTKLHETVGGNLSQGQVAADTTSATTLLQSVYASLEGTFTGFLEIFPLSEITTDEAILPTRGSNWDDNGIWRVLHQQKWDPNNSQIRKCFNSLGGIIFAATDILRYKPSLQQQAEARFLRAFAMYWMLDLFDQVPYREPGENLVQPAKIFKDTAALNYIINEVRAVEPDLPDFPPSNKANKLAAKVLLMKCYLNKSVYVNRSALPYHFDPADMNTVIRLADDVINAKFTFSDNYFDNFSPENASKSHENIFTQASNPDGNYAIFLSWVGPLTYAQGGANGFSTLSDFYNKFESTDKRKEAVYVYSSSNPNNTHVNVGFLIGQQYDAYSGSPLDGVIYTKEVQVILQGPDLLYPGIRPIKYAPDYFHFDPRSGTARNEFVYFRFPDVLLMKAEAILRGGTPTNAPYGNNEKEIVNAIRTDPSRGLKPMSTVTIDSLYDERGRELWWENWRRQDMIRFQKFLNPFQEKVYQSDPKYLLFPIPYDQLPINPNLQQNPGY